MSVDFPPHGYSRAAAAASLLVTALLLLSTVASAPVRGDDASGKGLFTASTTFPVPGETVFLNVTVSWFSNVTDSAFWSFGDGETVVGERVRHSWPMAGDYKVTLTIRFANGTVVEDSMVVHVEYTTFDYIFEVCWWSCLIIPVFAPFFILGVLVHIRSKRNDPRGKYYHFGVAPSLLLPVLVGSMLLQVFALFMPLLVGVCGGFLMPFVGFLFVLMLYGVSRAVTRTGRGRRLRERICIIPRTRRRIRRFREGFFRALWDRVVFAFHISPMALAIVFFLSALVANQLQSVDDIWNNTTITWLMFLAPLLSVIISPIQLMFDSSIVMLNRQDIRKAIQIRYLGEVLRSGAQSVIGFSAVVAFVGVVVEVYSDSLFSPVTIMAVGEAIYLILSWSLVIYAGLWMTMFIYSFFHEPLLKLLNRGILSMDLPVFMIKESADGKEISLKQVKLRTSNIDEILADGVLDEADVVEEG